MKRKSASISFRDRGESMMISNLNFTLTGPIKIPIVNTMRWQAVIVLLAIALSIVVPPSLPLMIGQGGQASIGTLDVCHSSLPALASNGNMPCVSECPCRPLPLAQKKVSEIANPPFKPLLIAFQDERPPKV
jgi:hypothetical protein